MLKNKRIVITTGEPSGIGPDLVIKLAQKTWPVELIVCSDSSTLIERAKQLNLPLSLNKYNPKLPPTLQKTGELTVLEIKTQDKVIPGKLNYKNSKYVISTLSRACDGCLRKEFSALVTGPVHKGIINKGDFLFSGHTEFLAKRSGCNTVIMMLVSKLMRVALATTHIPLSMVSNAINKKYLSKIIVTLNDEMNRKFKIKNPCIYICGLNPHAGEDGYIGDEEIKIISPVINSLCSKGYNLVGPLPADTIFQKKYLRKADVILAMYHDQGLSVIKYQCFGESVNVTLGLPFIRTSVDHGTALELSGSGNINSGSIENAINLTVEIIKNYNEEQFI